MLFCSLNPLFFLPPSRPLIQGVALLPFIDENRLKAAMVPHFKKLLPEEVKRNEKGEELLWFSGSHPMFDSACILYAKGKVEQPVPINPQQSGGLFGFMLPDDQVCIPGSTFYSPLTEFGMEDITDCQSLSVVYRMPSYPPGFLFPADLLPNVRLPPRELDENDRWFLMNGARRGRRPGGGRGGSQAAGRFIR